MKPFTYVRPADAQRDSQLLPRHVQRDRKLPKEVARPAARVVMHQLAGRDAVGLAVQVQRQPALLGEPPLGQRQTQQVEALRQQGVVADDADQAQLVGGGATQGVGPVAAVPQPFDGRPGRLAQLARRVEDEVAQFHGR